MGEKTFRDLERQAMALYRTKEYEQAFELIEREKQDYPDHGRQIAYLRMCLHALTGRQTEALAILRAALDQGEWFPPRWLVEDTDLTSLQTLPEFQQMLEVCRQRLAEAQMTSKPELFVKQPEQQSEKLPLLIAMHGNGGNGRRAQEEWDKITTQGWLLAIPQSSQIAGPDAYVWDERETGISEVRAHLAKLSDEYRVNPQRVVLGGFSMGGGQAVWMALHQAVKTCGFVVLGPYLRKEELESLPALLDTQKPDGVRGYILVGTEDHECLEVSRKVAEIMQAHDLACELEIRSGLDHSYPKDFGKVISKGLAFIEQA